LIRLYFPFVPRDLGSLLLRLIARSPLKTLAICEPHSAGIGDIQPSLAREPVTMTRSPAFNVAAQPFRMKDSDFPIRSPNYNASLRLPSI
jgi:hypothetical protein